MIHFNCSSFAVSLIEWFVNDAFERMWKKQIRPISGIIQAFAWNDIQKLWKILVKLTSFWDSYNFWYHVFWNNRAGVTSSAECLVKEYMRRHKWFLSDIPISYHGKGLGYCAVPSASWNWKRIYNQQRNLI